MSASGTSSTGRAPLLATHVITRLIVGGAQENTVATVLGLAQKPGLRLKLISGPPIGGEGSLEGEFREHPELLEIQPWLVRPVRPMTDVRALFQLYRIFRRDAPAIVHTHSGKAGIVGRFAARLARVPIIIHGLHGPSFGSWQTPAANLAFRAVERAAGKVTTHFVSVADAMIRQYLAAGIGTPERYTRIYSGFELEPFLRASNDLALRRKLGIGPGDLVIGKIARLVELKGHDDLFAIAPAFVREFPSARFLLVGGWPSDNPFRRLAASIGLEKHFIFTGLVPPSEIPALTGIMDLLIHLSSREGLPRALPQAMAAGKPVLAYDSDGAGEVCVTGRTGILIPPRDRARLLEAMIQLARDPELRRRLGSEGQSLARERFPVEKMIADTHALYRRLLEAAGLG